MRRAEFKSQSPEMDQREAVDIIRIMDAVASVLDIHISSDTARRAWEAHSEEHYAAGWMGIDGTDFDVAKAVQPYLRVQ